MALVKSTTLSTGVTGEYYRVISVQFDVRNNMGSCTVGLYKDKTARTAECECLQFYPFSFIGADNPITVTTMDSDNPISLMYIKLKTLAQFTDAVDD